MMAIQAPDGATYYDMGQLSSESTQADLVATYGFFPSDLPDFDHWMVWSFDTSMNGGNNPSALKLEIRQNIQTFYDETGMNYGDTVKVRMETPSDDGDVTAGKKYTFGLGMPEQLKAKSITFSSAKLSWKSAWKIKIRLQRRLVRFKIIYYP